MVEIYDSKKDLKKEELFSYVNGLLLYISKNTDIPSKELIDIFLNYNDEMGKEGSKGSEKSKGSKGSSKDTNGSRKKKKEKKEKKIYLEYIILDKKEYLLDNSTNDLYTYDDKKTFVGKYDVENDCINFKLK